MKKSRRNRERRLVRRYRWQKRKTINIFRNKRRGEEANVTVWGGGGGGISAAVVVLEKKGEGFFSVVQEGTQKGRLNKEILSRGGRPVRKKRKRRDPPAKLEGFLRKSLCRGSSGGETFGDESLFLGWCLGVGWGGFVPVNLSSGLPHILLQVESKVEKEEVSGSYYGSRNVRVAGRPRDRRLIPWKTRKKKIAAPSACWREMAILFISRNQLILTTFYCMEERKKSQSNPTTRIKDNIKGFEEEGGSLLEKEREGKRGRRRADRKKKRRRG